MKHLSTVAAIAIFGLVLSRQAHAAATLYTAPNSSNGANSTLYCDAVNTRSTPLAVTIEIYNPYGDLQSSLVNGAVQPGHAISMSNPVGGYCKFKVGGAKTSVAAMAVYSSNVTGHYLTVEVAR